jgi:hypothetical protein
MKNTQTYRRILIEINVEIQLSREKPVHKIKKSLRKLFRRKPKSLKSNAFFKDEVLTPNN